MIECRNITFAWPGADNPIFLEFSLSLNTSEVTAVLGASGSGKSTLLRIMAGLSIPQHGGVYFEGNRVTKPNPERTLVFQEYSLFDWMTVRQNIEVAMEWSGQKKSKDRVDGFLESVELSHAGALYPAALSGGMKQRAAIGRALAANPKIILMDEPFSSLDIHTRTNVQNEVTRLIEVTGRGAVIVTHYIDEAIFMADRIIVLSCLPAKIALDFRSKFFHPRTESLRKTDEFNELCTEISSAIAQNEKSIQGYGK